MRCEVLLPTQFWREITPLSRQNLDYTTTLGRPLRVSTMSTTTSKVAAGLFLAYATAISAPPVLGLVTSYVTFRQDHEHSFVGRTTTTRCRQHRRQKHHHDRTMTPTTTTSSQLQNNLYDDWSSDLLSSSQSEYSYDDLRLVPTDDMDIEESIVLCLEELMDSEYGKTMFGRHDVPASVG